MGTKIGAMTLAGLAVVLWAAPRADANDYFYRSYRGHQRFHDELGHREFHRHLQHRTAHRYPMTWGQHERLHDHLDHDRFHDALDHRTYHRYRYYPGSRTYRGYYPSHYRYRSGVGFGIHGRHFSLWFGH